MGSEVDSEPSSRPKLPLFLTIPPRDYSLPSSGMLTPPLQTSASVPFHWEEEPGKPRPCTDIIPLPNNNTKKDLELPPRLQVLIDSSTSKITKTPSPTTVLEGPDYVGKSIFSSASFRFSMGRERRQGSFDSNCSSGSPVEGGQHFGPMILGCKKDQKGRGVFGSFRLSTLNLRSGKKEAISGSSVISLPSFSSVDIAGSSDDYEDDKVGGSFDLEEGKKGRNIRRNGSFSNVSHTRKTQFWAAIYEGFKHVVPWKKTRNNKKQGFII